MSLRKSNAIMIMDALVLVFLLGLTVFSIRHHRAVVVGQAVEKSLHQTLATFNRCGPRIYVQVETGTGRN